MKAIQIEEFGEPDVLVLREVPDPVAGEGQVLSYERIVLPVSSDGATIDQLVVCSFPLEEETGPLEEETGAG